MMQIDLNCDMGESFGAWKMGNDQAILPLVSSVNIACGFHAGDPSVMHKTVQHALAQSVAVGAHPGLPDLVGFGRRNMAVSCEEVYDMVVYQVGALNGFVTALGGRLHHVKPHGALYNMAAVDAKIAAAIAQAVKDCTHAEIILYGLSGSQLIKQAKKIGLRAANEVFSDRTYQPDGTLTPRSQADALIHSDEKALTQVLDMVLHKKVHTVDGQQIAIEADTICIHGDGAHALEFARVLDQALASNNINVLAYR